MEQAYQLQQAGIINGKLNNLFDPTGTTTRVEVATMVERFVELIECPQE